MSRKDDQKAKPSGNGHNRIEGFVFGIRLEGTEEVVTEGIKAFTSAMAKGGMILTPAPAPKGVLAASSRPRTATESTVDAEDDLEQAEEAAEATEDQGAEEELEEESSNGSGPRRAYTFKAPTFLHDVDISKAAKPLVDFMAEKGNPTETIDRYIVIAVWLKDVMSIDRFTINHIWTAYSALGWKAQFPENHSQPLRDLKSKKNYLTREKGEGYKVSWPGEQYVEKMGAAK